MVIDQPWRSFGQELEIKGNSPGDPHWITREHHSRWFRFQAEATGLLSFDITPHDPADDIDFLLFHAEHPDFCSAMRDREVLPVRSNISRNDPALQAMCGLRVEAIDEYVHSGVGSSYSKALEVEEGQLFYLLVDYPNPPRAGLTLQFHYDPLPTEEDAVEAGPPLATLILEITDGETGLPVAAEASITGIRPDSVVKLTGESHYRVNLSSLNRLRVDCLREGYMLRSQTVRIAGAGDIHAAIQLTPIRPDAKVVIDDILFEGNGHEILSSSERSLLLLLEFMEQNPGVHVEVQGHVNAPGMSNRSTLRELSAARALEVQNYLLVNDISPDRVVSVGMGNSAMLYPKPRNEAEKDANRRVEVVVTSIDGPAGPFMSQGMDPRQ